MYIAMTPARKSTTAAGTKSSDSRNRKNLSFSRYGAVCPQAAQEEPETMDRPHFGHRCVSVIVHSSTFPFARTAITVPAKIKHGRLHYNGGD
jgi:hypothetical protein